MWSKSVGYVFILMRTFDLVTIHQSWQSLSGPSGYEDLNNINVAPHYSFDATKRAIASLKLQVEEISKIEISKISGTGRKKKPLIVRCECYLV